MIVEESRRIMIVCVALALVVSSGFVFAPSAEASGGGSEPRVDDFWLFGDLARIANEEPEHTAMTFLNERTNETLYVLTDTGRYRENLANFTSGYERGDDITIESLVLNATGNLEVNVTAFTVPPVGNDWRQNISLELTELPDIFAPEEPPYGYYAGSSGGGDSGPPGGPGEEGKPPKSGGDDSTGSGEGGGFGPKQPDCDVPPWGDSWIVTYDQHCINMAIDISGSVQVYATLTLENVDLSILPETAPDDGIYVFSGGALSAVANGNGGTFITEYTSGNSYVFHVYGTLEVSGSTVEHTSSGIVFHTGGSGTFDKYGSLDSVVRYSDSDGIMGDSSGNILISDTEIYENQGHGVHLDNTFARIEYSHIWGNSDSGVHIENTGLMRSCYGQPEVDNSILAYWAWCDDDYWYLQWTSDGGTYHWEWEIRTAYNTYIDDSYIPGGVFYDDPSPWAEYTLKVNGNLVATNTIYFGYAGDHPSSNPFTLSREAQPLIRLSWIESNTWGISSDSSAPAIINNIEISGEGGIRDNEIGIRVPKSAPVIYYNDILENSQHGIWTGVYAQNPKYHIAANTITGPTTPTGFGIFLHAEQHKSLVKNNDVSSHKWGIYIGYGQYYVIEENYVHGNTDIGIYAYGVHSNWVEVVNNDIYSNPIGMDLRMSPSVTAEDNSVTGNTIAGIQVRSRYPWSGTTLDKPVVRGNQVYSNTNVNGDAVGIKVREWEDGSPEHYVVGATPLIEANDVYLNDLGIASTYSAPDIEGNNQVHENTYGVYIEGFYDDHGVQHQAEVSDSDIFLNTETGVWVLDSSPTIQSNDIHENKYGVVVDSRRGISNPVIFSNSIHLNGEQGIHSWVSAPFVGSNSIESNRIGVHIFGVPMSGVPILEDNTISDNLQYGISASHSNPQIIGTSKFTQVIEGNGVGPLGSNIGILLDHASPFIFQNKIAGKVVMEQGPGYVRISVRQDVGIFAYDSSPIISDNYIGGHRYYGIYSHWYSSMTIIRNEIVNNWWWGPASGIFLGRYDQSVVGGLDEGNTIYGRYASIIVNYAQPLFPVIEGNFMGSYWYFDYVDILTMYSTARIGEAQVGRGNTISGARFGIYECIMSSSTIRGNTISATTYVWPAPGGVAVKIDWFSSTNVGLGNEIKDSYWGITVEHGSFPYIHDSWIVSNEIGIHVLPTASSSTSIEFNGIVENIQVGVILESMPVQFVLGPTNNIGMPSQGNGLGIYVYTGSPTIEGNIIGFNAGDGILSDFATPTIGGSEAADKNEFEGNGGWAVHTRSAEASNWDSLLADNDMSNSAPRKVWHQWQLTIHVQDSGGSPIQGANAWSWCQMLGQTEVSGTTDSNGDVIGWATEYQIRFTTVEDTMHDIYAQWGYVQVHWNVYIDQNWVETFTF